MNNDKQIDSILKIIPDDYRKYITGLEIKTSVEGPQMLIFDLSRDQRMKFKRLAPLLEDGKSISFYVKHNSKFHHIGGEAYVFDKINNYNYNISPYSPIKTPKQSTFYRTIKNSSPKGTTRNAIIINTHNGLIPMHLSKLYNRLYCVDVADIYSAEAKMNLKLNKINNCLLFSSHISKWLREFEGYKYTPPGRKHKIGLIVCDAAMLTEESCSTILNIEPETIILFSENEETVNKMSKVFEAKEKHEKTYESFVEGFHIRKIKRKEHAEL
ncbi:MAG: hypothetical protein WCQ53_00605 [bacterium]